MTTPRRILLLCSLLTGCFSSPNEDGDQVNQGAKPSSDARYQHQALGSCDASLCTVQLQYHPETPLARAAELFFRHSANLRFERAVSGDALASVDKQLVAQTRQPGEVRLVAFSPTNTLEIPAGMFATLTFARTDAERATVEIVRDRPMFAPAVANELLAVSPPLEL
jgi:hypothetical protein